MTINEYLQPLVDQKKDLEWEISLAQRYKGKEIAQNQLEEFLADKKRQVAALDVAIKLRKSHCKDMEADGVFRALSREQQILLRDAFNRGVI